MVLFELEFFDNKLARIFCPLRLAFGRTGLFGPALVNCLRTLLRLACDDCGILILVLQMAGRYGGVVLRRLKCAR